MFRNTVEFGAGAGTDGVHGNGLRAVVAALGSSLGTEGGRDLRSTFEREAARVLAVGQVRLREAAGASVAEPGVPGLVAVPVPTADPRGRVVLEARFDQQRGMESGRAEMLATLAVLGGLVVQADRGRQPVPPSRSDAAPGMIGESDAMCALRARIARVAATDLTVLIEGESGTGKELVARQVHERSRRQAGPFVAVNCAAIVESLLEAELFGIEERTATGVRGRRGKFEQAEGGTLFLDEVGDLSPSAQAKLLRVLQDLSVERVGGHVTKAVNTRVVAATNRPLQEMVANGVFRADLYYRLAGIDLRVPPLRGRRQDIPDLARHFLDRAPVQRRVTFDSLALDALSLHDWPGNVRELQRVVEAAGALAEADCISLEDLPPHVRGDYGTVLAPSLAAGESLRAWGRRYARLVFERCGRNKRLACRRLDISYHTLQAYLRPVEAALLGAAAAPEESAWVRSLSDPAGDRPTRGATQVQQAVQTARRPAVLQTRL